MTLTESRDASLNRCPSFPVIFGFLLLLIFSFHAKLSAASAVDKVAKSARVAQGEQLFQQKCASCHRVQPDDTSPFGPPNLYGVFDDKTKMTPQQAEAIIKQGKNSMPAYGATLSDLDVDNLIAYLRTLSPLRSQPAPRPVRGQADQTPPSRVTSHGLLLVLESGR